jgi:hypothetical protein
MVLSLLGWGFFLSDRAGSRVLLGVPAEACGLRQPPELAAPGHIPLSPGHSSLRPRSLELARSPQRPQRRPIQIRGLRADESSGWITASDSKGNRLRCVLSVNIDNYRRNATSWQHENFASDHSGSRRPARPDTPARSRRAGSAQCRPHAAGSAGPARPRGSRSVRPSRSQRIRAWHAGRGGTQTPASHRLPAVGTARARTHYTVAVRGLARHSQQGSFAQDGLPAAAHRALFWPRADRWD